MPLIPVLAGATASGKTALALELGERHRLEVVSADAMMVYRGMDVGTAKPTPAERARVPHHVVDVVEPDEPFDVRRWVGLAEAAVEDVVLRGRLPLVVGGTGFYIRALTEGAPSAPASDPDRIASLESELGERGLDELHRELHDASPADAQRAARNPRRVLRALEILRMSGRPPASYPPRPPRYRFAKVVLDPPRAELDRRIADRVDTMFAAGLVDEVRHLASRWPPVQRRPTALQAIGYREVLEVIAGKAGEDEARDRIVLATRRYAKRQSTWFRREPGAVLVPTPDAARARLEETVLASGTTSAS